MGYPVVKAVTYALCHVPHLVPYGSKPRRELAKAYQPLMHQIERSLRSFEEVVAYLPNQVYIGNLDPGILSDIARPWWQTSSPNASRFSKYGEIMPEIEFYGLLKLADQFNLVYLSRDLVENTKRALGNHPLCLGHDAELLEGVDEGSLEQARLTPGCLPLYMYDFSEPVGYVLPGHEEDTNLSAEILLENLCAKASAALALRHLIAASGIDPGSIEYVLNCGEEAVGDRYQRGGGSLSKAIAEQVGLSNCSGSDVKAFCCAPVHSLVLAASLVHAGIFENVVVVGGGSLAKLGMKFRSHLDKEMPILEDVLAAIAILISRDDGVSPQIRLDAVGRHRVGSGGAQQAILEDLVRTPLERVGLRLTDIDRYATEMHNPEITEPSGSGNVPLRNYRMIASLAALAGEISPSDIDRFVSERGVPGFSPTQGHIAAAVPLLGHALRDLRYGRMRRVFLLAKGSLFLGKMTHMSDGMSVLLEGR